MNIAAIIIKTFIYSVIACIIWNTLVIGDAGLMSMLPASASNSMFDDPDAQRAISTLKSGNIINR